MITLSLYAFVCCLFLHLWRTALISYTGFDSGPYFGLASVPIGAVSSYLLIRTAGTSHITKSFKTRMLVLAVLVLIAAINGYTYENRLRFMLLDLAIFTTFIISAILGTYDRVWQSVLIPLTILTLLSLPITLLGVNRAELIISEFGSQERSVVYTGRYGVETLAYRLYPALLASPLIFIVTLSEKRWSLQKIIGTVAMATSIALTIFFWKRGPFAYGLSLAISGVLLNLYISRKSSVSIVIIASGFLALAVAIAGSENLIALLSRYQATLDNFGGERWEEPYFLLSDFGPLEYLMGRGLGGWYDTPIWWTAGVSLVTDSGVIGRESIHAGIFWPFIKGGVILFLVYHSFAVASLKLRPRIWLCNRFNLCSAAILPSYLLFSLFQNVPTMSSAVELMMIGLCVGRYGIRSSTETNSLAFAYATQVRLPTRSSIGRWPS